MSKVRVEKLSPRYRDWAVEVASVRMLVEEVKDPKLVNIPQIYTLVDRTSSEGTFLIALADETPIGALGAIRVPNIYNPSLTALTELFWYVLPEWRSSRAGLLLLKGLIEMGRDDDYITMSLLPASEINEKTLQKYGFIHSERSFVKVKDK